MDLPSSTAAAARGKKCHRGIEHWATVGKPENINTMERSKQLIQQPRAQTMERKHQCVKVILVIYAHDKKRIIMWREGYVEYYVSLTQEPMQWRNKNKRGYAPYIGVGQPWWQINVVSFHLSAPPRKPWGSIISPVPCIESQWNWIFPSFSHFGVSQQSPCQRRPKMLCLEDILGSFSFSQSQAQKKWEKWTLSIPEHSLDFRD